jgi:flagellar motor switch protein FliG
VAVAVQPRPTSLKGIHGPDRVAAILLTMGKSLSARLMKHFDPDEIRRITRSAADLRPVPAQALSVLIEEFATQFAVGASLVSSPGEVERMLDGVLPKEQIEEILGDLAGNPDRSIWERMSGISEQSLATHLEGEHPQTAALILSRVKPATAAKVMAHMAPQRRNGVIRRMLSIKPPVDEAIRMLERILHQEFTANAARSAMGEGQEHLAEIINRLDRAEIEQVLQSLSATSPKAAASLKSRLFTFDDLAKVSTRARAALFDKVPTEKVVLALKGAAAELREMVLSALSSRVRKMIEQELNNGQGVPSRDVNEARRAITDLALEMASRGEIEIRGDAEDLVG